MGVVLRTTVVGDVITDVLIALAVCHYQSQGNRFLSVSYICVTCLMIAVKTTQYYIIVCEDSTSDL